MLYYIKRYYVKGGVTMKKIPIGLSDFKKLIEGNYYYFDKTNFIDEIIKDGSEVKLFTRPRRFGKTLNMSMLKYFFDIKEAEENRKLFKNLYIEKTENFKEQGQYPVVFLSLKDLKADNWENWVDTSGNDLINDVLKIVRKDIIRDLKKLFDGEGLKQNLLRTSDLSRLLSEEEI